MKPYSVLKELISNSKFSRLKAHVVFDKKSIGGCVDFAWGITIRDILYEINKLHNHGIELRKIYILALCFVSEKNMT